MNSDVSSHRAVCDLQKQFERITAKQSSSTNISDETDFFDEEHTGEYPEVPTSEAVYLRSLQPKFNPIVHSRPASISTAQSNQLRDQFSDEPESPRSPGGTLLAPEDMAIQPEVDSLPASPRCSITSVDGVKNYVGGAEEQSLESASKTADLRRKSLIRRASMRSNASSNVDLEDILIDAEPVRNGLLEDALSPHNSRRNSLDVDLEQQSTKSTFYEEKCEEKSRTYDAMRALASKSLKLNRKLSESINLVHKEAEDLYDMQKNMHQTAKKTAPKVAAELKKYTDLRNNRISTLLGVLENYFEFGGPRHPTLNLKNPFSEETKEAYEDLMGTFGEESVEDVFESYLPLSENKFEGKRFVDADFSTNIRIMLELVDENKYSNITNNQDCAQ